MRDRIPGAPGQYAMRIDSESLQKFLNAEECTVVLQRDDHPIIEGTPLNKATFLPDDLAAELCPDIDDPTPADAVRKLARNTNEAYKATESEEHPGCYYRIVNGTTEWMNPPMIPGVEYRTTERYNGYAVYRKLVVHKYEGTMGSSSSYKDYSIPHGISDLKKAVRCFTNANTDGLWPSVGSLGGIANTQSIDATNVTVRIWKTDWNSPVLYFDLAYCKEGVWYW